MNNGIFMTPKEIVNELDRYIVGQDKAKRTVAIALRNRWRRLQVENELREEITPNNILMIGPTGVGKTEIARRLANLAKAPFVKVEATRFTEVGYVGRDVESMVRELVEIAFNMVKAEKIEEVQEKAGKLVEEKLIDLVFPPIPGRPESDLRESREKIREMLTRGEFDEKVIEIDIERRASPFVEVFGPQGIEELNLNIPETLESILPKFKKKRKVTVKEAKRILLQEEAQKLIDMDEVATEAVKRAETTGIIFLDEIDKVTSSNEHIGPDVSREGVQRDLLPIIEGSNVMTKYGMVKTDHILFIAAGAFHNASPSDLIPELQGRFPLRVELDNLTEEDFRRILIEPENSLIRQYSALVRAEGVELEVTEEAVAQIAKYAVLANDRTENIGARRLHTVMSLLLEDILFSLPKKNKRGIKIDKEFVDKRLKNVIEDEDLSKYIL